MKKVLILLCLVLTVLFVGQGVSAQEGGAFGLGVRLSYLNLDDDNFDSSEVDFEDTFALGLNGTYFFCRWFSIEMSLDYAESDADVSDPAGSGNLGDLEQIPLLLTGRIHWPVSECGGPYLGLGIGYYFNDISANGAYLAQQGIVSIDIDDSFGYHIGAGIEWFLNANLAVNVDLKYIWSEADFDTTDNVGTETIEVDLDGFMGGIGLKYYF